MAQIMIQFMRLYREGVNLSSMEYNFLCFFRITEGIILLRRKRIAKRKGKSVGDVPRPRVFLEGEIVEGEGADQFSPELRGESLYKAYEELNIELRKVAHAFLDEEDPVSDYENIIVDRLGREAEEATRRAKARYIARRMLDSGFPRR
jgi:hypothetical protein